MTMRGERSTSAIPTTGVTDFGITLDAILSGKEKIPPQGARVDVAYAGLARVGSADRCEGSITRSYAPTTA